MRLPFGWLPCSMDLVDHGAHTGAEDRRAKSHKGVRFTPSEEDMRKRRRMQKRSMSMANLSSSTAKKGASMPKKIPKVTSSSVSSLVSPPSREREAMLQQRKRTQSVGSINRTESTARRGGRQVRQTPPRPAPFRDLRTSLAERLSAGLPGNSSFVQQMTQFIAAPDTLERPEIQEMPKWELDDDVNDCNLCHNPFTFSRRKHHCRLCGKIFCHNCSNNQVRISSFYNYPQRICNGCFNTIRDRSLQQRAEQFRFSEEYPEVPCILNRVPDAILIKVLRFVPERNLLLDVALVCKHLHYLTNTNELWRPLFLRHWAPHQSLAEMEGGEGQVVVEMDRVDSASYPEHGRAPGSWKRLASTESEEGEGEGGSRATAKTRVVYLDDDDFDEGYWKLLFRENIERDRRERSTFTYLPATAVRRILTFLAVSSPLDLLAASQVCRRWRKIIGRGQLWQRSCQAAGGCRFSSASASLWRRHVLEVHYAAEWYVTYDFATLLQVEGKDSDARSTAVHSEIRKITLGQSQRRLEAMLEHGGRQCANARDSSRSFALHLAVRLQCGPAVRLLLRHGADVNARTGGTGRTALHMAMDIERSQCDAITEALLAASASVADVDYVLGNTALHAAVRERPHLVARLLQADAAEVAAAVATRNEAGVTPALLACQLGSSYALSAFLEHDASGTLQARDGDGRSALMLAACHGGAAMVEALLDEGADCDERVPRSASCYSGTTAAEQAASAGKLANSRMLRQGERAASCVIC